EDRGRDLQGSPGPAADAHDESLHPRCRHPQRRRAWSRSMKRNKLWALVIAALVFAVVGAWLLLGAADERPSEHDADSSEDEPHLARKKPRRASARPDLANQAKAAITGTVRDREGQPIAGAQVCAWPHTGDLEGLAPGFPRCTKTEADGHYRLEPLLPVRM